MSSEKTYGGHSMAARLRRVLVCAPASAGWTDPRRAEAWEALGFFHPPSPEALRAHARLVEILGGAGAEVLELPAGDGLTLDAVYTHDPSFMTDFGAICLRLGKRARQEEPRLHEELYASQGIPMLGRLEAPGMAEGGDMVWLDADTLLIGRGYRTNAEGISQIAGMLRPHGVKVIEAPLPHGRGPSACLHLMSLMSVLGERKILVDPEWLAVQTVELLRRMEFDMIEIDPDERATLACNVLALGEGKLAAIEENASTIGRLREAGFDVATFPGPELCHNGSGGPTCLTRPILRG